MSVDIDTTVAAVLAGEVQLWDLRSKSPERKAATRALAVQIYERHRALPGSTVREMGKSGQIWWNEEMATELAYACGSYLISWSGAVDVPSQMLCLRDPSHGESAVRLHSLLNGKGSCVACGYAATAAARSSDAWQRLLDGPDGGMLSGYRMVPASSKSNAALGREEMRVQYTCTCGFSGDMWAFHWKHGRRCPACAPLGYQPSKPGTLYFASVVRLPGQTRKILQKVGITNTFVRRSGEHRSSGLLFAEGYGSMLTHNDGRIAHEIERWVKRIFSGSKAQARGLFTEQRRAGKKGKQKQKVTEAVYRSAVRLDGKPVDDIFDFLYWLELNDGDNAIAALNGDHLPCGVDATHYPLASLSRAAF